MRDGGRAGEAAEEKVDALSTPYKNLPLKARPGEGQAPQAGVVCIEPNERATTSLGRKGGECERAVSEISRGGIKATRGTIGASLLFFPTSRTLARLTCPPVWR